MCLMNRIARVLSLMFFAAIMYLILAEALSPLFNLPSLGNIGFVLFFVLFPVSHFWATEGAKRTAFFFSVSAVVSKRCILAVLTSGLGVWGWDRMCPRSMVVDTYGRKKC